jgi:diguanylate cyclase (GGDEF)-like protein
MRERRARTIQVLAEVKSGQPARKEDQIQPFGVRPLLDSFDKHPLWHRRLIVGLVILLIGAVDYMTGYEASVASLYVIPVLLAGWSLGLASGLAFALAASATLVLTNWLAGQSYSAFWILIWNILVRGGTFAALGVLASSLRKEMEHVHRLSLSDTLTSAWNRRAFYQAFAIELSRVARNPTPFSVAYLDLDDFKSINDRLGHETGDEVLKAVVKACTHALRLQDTVARLGGDEFAILMPDTDEVALTALLERLRDALIDATVPMTRVNCSIGAIAFMEIPASVTSALHMADKLMYKVKASGKGHMICERYPPQDAGI